MGIGVGNLQQIEGSHTSRQQRLVSIAEGRVCNQQLLLLGHPLCEASCSEFLELIAGSLWRCNSTRHSRDWCGLGSQRFWSSFHETVAVHDGLGEEGQESSRTVLAEIKLEQFRRLIDKSSRAVTVHKCRVIHHLGKKRNVGLHATNSEFLQSAVHAMNRIDKAASASCHFGQQRIIKRIHHRTGKRAAGVEPNAHAAG